MARRRAERERWVSNFTDLPTQLRQNYRRSRRRMVFWVSRYPE